MGSSSFRLQIIIRVVLLTVTALLFVVLVTAAGYPVTMIAAGVALVLQAVLLVRFVEGASRDLERFLEAIRYSDFTHSFVALGRGKALDDTAKAFNAVMQEFRKVRGEREEQYRFLETLIQHVGVGLLTFSPDGSVGLINTAAKRLLRVNSLRQLRELEPVSPLIVRALFGLTAGDRVVVRTGEFPEPLQLILHATGIRLHDQQYMLVSLQNIQSELDAKEMEAWQKLIRVLTHEIMNSITPISSLASTGSVILQSDALAAAEGKARDALHDLGDAMQAIARRSEGLLGFVEAYRSLTLVPPPVLRPTGIEPLVRRVDLLFRPQCAAEGITLTTVVEPGVPDLHADAGQIEQVLINILQNALAAVAEREDGRIGISVALDGHGKTMIEISDNGRGISPEMQEKIFVPFFTTKEKGSGIGLSLSRQIVHLHGGTLACTSKPGEGSVFTIRF